MTKSVRVSEEESACVRENEVLPTDWSLCWLLFAEELLVLSPVTPTLSKGLIPVFPSFGTLGLATFMLTGFGFFGFVFLFCYICKCRHLDSLCLRWCFALSHTVNTGKKEYNFIFVVEESLKVFTELFWVQENWEQTPSSLTSDFLQRSIRDFLPVAVWRCWQVKHTMANNFQSFNQSKYSFINMHTELSVSLPSLLRDTEGERWVFFCLLANQEWCLVHS